MNNQDVLLRNNTGSKVKASLIDGFVVRTWEFDQLKNGLFLEGKKKPKNTVIVGQRGAGKTTLVHRLRYEIQDNEVLSNKYFPIIFSEEQYGLSDLTSLWESVAINLEDNYEFKGLSKNILKIIESEKDEVHFEEKSYEYLQNILSNEGKYAILFIENVNFYLKKLSNSEKARFLKILSSNSNFVLIGTSTSVFDGVIDFQEPAFDFIHLMQLDGLTKSECEELLIKIGEQYGEAEQIKRIIANHPGRIEALRRLTGGVPRTLSYLFQIFLDNENGKAIKDLYLLIDTLTPIYKAELDQLSTQQQRVVDSIAKNWDAISVKEIAQHTRLESKNISSILIYLEKNQIIEKIKTNTKNHLYRIRERFMNIWYLMRFGRKNDQANVIWLVRFFDAWCDEAELTNRIKKHINNLKLGNYDLNAAIDMGNTFLSCENISESLKDELIKTTNSILPEKLLKNTKSNTLIKIRKLINKGELKQAAQLIEGISDRNKNFYTLAIYVYLKNEDYIKALEYAEKAWEIDDQDALTANTLAVIYDLYLEDKTKAIEYYTKSLELPHPHPYSAYRLGVMALEEKDYEVAIKYQKLAKGFTPSFLALGDIYFEMERYQEAKKYYTKALNNNVEGANTKLARVFKKLNNDKETEEALKKAVALEEDGSDINIGYFYLLKTDPDFDKAKSYFSKAIENNNLDGYDGLAQVYIRQELLDDAIHILREGIAHNHGESAHQLAHLLNRSGSYGESDEMFQKAINLGVMNLESCWARSIYYSRRVKQKSQALDLLEKVFKEDNSSTSIRTKLLYAKILLWNNKLDRSLNIIKDQIVNIDDLYDENNTNKSHKIFSDYVDYFLLLIAKDEVKVLIDFFESDNNAIDLQIVFKPIYFILMESLKEDYPNVYLKAGKELKETIQELKNEINELRNYL
ncbi:tetratricopeptide repeat protein [Chryseobacterium aureum]|uniref:tetratricopeptide repeat protein n=1 Tax=Chryseobacterium aureum TaxID=2497456 RepID=UPI000F87091F|nr:tetratricopeptide repeat protein [Chryseobacterium aureum]